MTRRIGELVVAALVLLVVCAVVTWPQARVLGTQAVPHQDVYFNMWRLEWVAHAIATRPSQLLDANIFYPEPRTLTLSDAMLVEGSLASPLVWLGIRPVLLENVFIFGAMVASGLAMFALVRELTRSGFAAAIGGVVFAFAPFRFEHVMHMEMQWAMWSPLAFLFLHRTFRTGRWRDGAATGLFVALQMLSSVYYGVFLATLLAAGAIVLSLGRAAQVRRAWRPLAAGALLAAAICGAYAVPYLRTARTVGDRSTEDVRRYSATPINYLAVPEGNRLYESIALRGTSERRLFPGLIPVLLAMAGVLLRPRGRRRITYVLLLVLAFEMSLGVNGFSYRLLYRFVPVYHGLRAPARLGIFVLLFLGVLAGYGYAAIASGRRLAVQAAIAAMLVAGLVLEYRVSLALVQYPNAAPPVYRFLAQQPRGVVAEVPFPLADALPGNDAEYEYGSIFHWFPLVNGYSGVYPPSYLARLDRVRGFPDATALRQLEHDSVAYVIVHGDDETAEAAMGRMIQSGRFVVLARFTGATLFRFK